MHSLIESSNSTPNVAPFHDLRIYTREDTREKLSGLLTALYYFTAGLGEVIIYSSPDDNKKNRGFCFLEYESHKAASLAKRRLGTGRTKVITTECNGSNQLNLQHLLKVWGCDIIVDWADPQEEPDAQTMSKVKVLYVRNLTQDTSEEKLKVNRHSYAVRHLYLLPINCHFRNILRRLAKWRELKRLKTTPSFILKTETMPLLQCED